MNDVFAAFALGAWKPVLTTLLLPPVPLLLLVLIGAWLLARRRGGGWAWLGVGVVGLWLSGCSGVGAVLERLLLTTPPVLDETHIAQLAQRMPGGRRPVVLVLGGGRQPFAPEYGQAHLSPRSLQRLHYGIWLSRRLGAPLMISGGNGLGERNGVPEAEVAARIAERDYGRAPRWLESASRDTRENAAYSIGLLADQEVGDIVLVTHGWHMPRAQRAFEDAIRRAGLALRVVPAPMGLAAPDERPLLQWLPGLDGAQRVRLALREALGLRLGA